MHTLSRRLDGEEQDQRQQQHQQAATACSRLELTAIFWTSPILSQSQAQDRQADRDWVYILYHSFKDIQAE